MEVLSRIQEPEAWMVTGERAFQAAGLLFMENWHQVVQNSQKLDNLVESMGELRELRQMVRRQGEMILSLTYCIMRLERRSRRSRRSLGDSLSCSSGSSFYGTAWTGSWTRELLVVEHPVQVNFLEPVNDSEEDREVCMVENVRPVLVRALTLGLSCLSLAQRLGINFWLWRNNGGTSDRDQSGFEGWAGVSEGVRWVIQGSPPRLCFGSVDLELATPPPPYIRDDQLAPM